MNAKPEINEAGQVAHKSVYAALVRAQANMTKALKDVPNGAFKTKYADLANVQDACFPALNAEGIAIIQPTGEDDSGRFVETVFYHAETDTQIKCRVPLIVGKNDMQGYGSAVTYARRYGLMSLAGIAPEDDDGNAAAKAAPPKQEPQGQPPKSETTSQVSAAEMKRGLEEIDNDLIDCRTIEDVNKCAKIWAALMQRDGWSKDYRDIAAPKFQMRRDQINAADTPFQDAAQ